MSVPGPERDVTVGHGAGPGEARVDVDHRRAPRLGLHHPLEADRVALGHVGALDDDAVGVLQVLLERGGAAPAERCPQTGDGGAVSDAGLVLDLDGAERGEQLLDEVVLLVVERRPAQAGRSPACAGPACPPSSHCQPSRRVSMTRSAIMSMASSRARSSQSVPWGRR